MFILEIERRMPLEVEVEVEVPAPSIVVVRLCGAADADQVDDLKRQLESAVWRNTCFVILDLARLDFLSPEALDCLDEFRRDQCWRGGEVWLAGLQPAVWLAFHAAGLDRRFTVRASL